MKTTLTSHLARALNGTIKTPGDKSISHRALMLGAVANGTTRITGLLEGEDVLATAAAMRALGATIEKCDDGSWQVDGIGLGHFQQPNDVLDMGNSGTSARLLSGLIAGSGVTATLTGDASLQKRPMGRVITPLSEMRVDFESQDGGRMPLKIIGVKTPKAITYELPVASAQVKSAILLAGLTADGPTTVIESKATRDHSEIMLENLGADVQTTQRDDGCFVVTVTGGVDLTAQNIAVPADPSSAAFLTVAALLVAGSDIVIPNVCMNPRRTGLYQTLIEMGGNIIFENERVEGGENIADLRVRHSALKGVDVPADRAPSMIDEYPVLFVAASCASGTTRMTGLEELRVKESDRLAVMAKGLLACGVDLEAGEDSLVIHGTGQPPKGGAEIETVLDHRIAMSFLILGCVAQNPVTIDDAAPIATSFPGFVDVLNTAGGKLAFAA